MRDGRIEGLRGLLRDAFGAQYGGASGARSVRAQAYADGYARALMDGGVIDARGVLALVAEERARAAGPGTTTWQPEASATATAG